MKQNVNYILHHKNVNLKLSELKLTSSHISIYNALFLIWNNCSFDTELSINRNDVMKLSKIGSANTYTKCLKELDKNKIISYKPSYNPLIGSKVVIYRFDNSSSKGSSKGSDNSSSKGSVNSSSKGSDNSSSKGSDNSSDTLYKLLNKETIKLINNKNYTKKINDNLKKWLGLEDEIDKYNPLMSEIKISDVEEKNKIYFKIAFKFYELFVKNLKDKNSPTKKIRKSTYKNFVNPIRLMFEQDGITREQLLRVYDFLNSNRCENEKFSWKTNILSTSKLRKQFETLSMKSNEVNNTNPVNIEFDDGGR